MQGLKRSLIKKYFTPEVCLDIERVIMTARSNNQKGFLVEDVLTKYDIPFSRLATGTNRLGVQIDGYAVKIALDKDGKIDNQREFKYSKMLQPYAIKVYEIDKENGLLAVTEYVNSFTESDFKDIHRQSQMRDVLSDISENFLIGDVGINSKNYGNWGIRVDDDSVVMLDFAYIYAISYRTFQCKCGTILKYDNDYDKLICERCRSVYTFGAIRKKISKKQQKEEIGDLTKLGYVITEPEQMVELKMDLEPKLLEQAKIEAKKAKDPFKIELAKHRKRHAKEGLFKRKENL